MNLLLDTHIFLWWADDRARIVESLQRTIGKAERVHVSVASAWEIAIKTALGKLAVRGDVEASILASGFEPLSITFEHTRRVATLPPKHGDPFDRMLVAQALVEGLTLVTTDRRLSDYAVPIIRA